MKKILNKILDEINKESPRLDYIRGLIEASVEEDEITVVDVDSTHPNSRFRFQASIKNPDGTIRASLGDTPEEALSNLKEIDPELPPPPDFKNIGKTTDD